MLRSSQSKHEELAELLVERIRSSSISVGDQMPTRRALMEEYGVSDSTVNRAVLELTKEGYISSTVGKGTFVIRSQPEKTSGPNTERIGVLLCNCEPTGELVSVELHRLESKAWDLSHTLVPMVIKTGRGDEARRKIARLAEETAGFIVSGSFTKAFLQGIASFGRPGVVLGFPTDSGDVPDGMDSITVNVRSGIREAVEYLAGTGRKRIVLVNGHDSFFFKEIDKGYHEAVETIPGLCGGVRTFSGNMSMADGRRCAKNLLDASDTPDAVIVASDRVFVGMYECFAEQGVRVPEDMSVVVVGESIFGSEASPGLVRIEAAHGAYEEAAVRVLLRRIDDPTRLGEQVTLAWSLVGEDVMQLNAE